MATIIEWDQLTNPLISQLFEPLLRCSIQFWRALTCYVGLPPEPQQIPFFNSNSNSCLYQYIEMRNGIESDQNTWNYQTWLVGGILLREAKYIRIRQNQKGGSDASRAAD